MQLFVYFPVRSRLPADIYWLFYLIASSVRLPAIATSVSWRLVLQAFSGRASLSWEDVLARMTHSFLLTCCLAPCTHSLYEYIQDGSIRWYTAIDDSCFTSLRILCVLHWGALKIKLWQVIEDSNHITKMPSVKQLELKATNLTIKIWRKSCNCQS